MDTLSLTIPGPEHQAAVMAMAAEILETDGDGIHGGSGLGVEFPLFAQWLEAAQQTAAGNPPFNWTAADTYLGVGSDGSVVGIINIRHHIHSDFMRLYGGHIGYSVRPSERRRGYAKQMLRLAIERCRQLGLERALVTCNPANTASARTIMACGGMLENILPFPDDGGQVARYWVDIT